MFRRLYRHANHAMALTLAIASLLVLVLPSLRAAALPLDQGPGGPVLVVQNTANKFSRYYSEILRAEGYNTFATADVSAITSTLLNQYDVVVVGEVPLTAAQVTTLTTWVNNGGNLIAMRPDKKLKNLLGLTDQSATLAEGYMLANTTTAPGLGITNQTMQYHGIADEYALVSGTTAVATLYSNATTATTNPAVSLRSIGTKGGQAAAFTYDLAKSVVYTHQGNPAWAGQERDGNSPIRPNDLFYGAKAGDVQPDYINLDKVAIPQADEQQRLLGNMIQMMNKDRKVIPHFWYFPKGAKAVVVMASDDHSTASGTQDSFNRLLTASPAGCNVANWECARSTSLTYESSPMTNATAASYAAQGFDIGSHVSTGCSDWTPASLESSISADLSAFTAKYTSLPAQHVTRTHCIAWSDWATAPKTELAHGLRLDLNYYYWPGSWVQNRPGFFTGNGVPMRFADSDGSMIDVYQLPSHLVNESGMAFPQAINTVLDRALGAEGYYGAFGTHYDFSDTFDQQLIAAAQSRGVPLVSGQQMLNWSDARNNSTLGAPTWSGNNLSFTATVDANTNGMLRTMLPLSSSKGRLTGIKKSGVAVSYTTEVIKGIQYAVFAASTGTFTASYAADTTAPTVTTTVPAAGAGNVSATANVTATFSEPMDHTTINATTVSLKNSTNVTVPATVTYNAATKQATLDPTATLLSGTYTATIRGGTTAPVVKDISGNALATTKTWSFTVVGTTCPCTVWPASTVPTNPLSNDTSAVEVGVKFNADAAGKITAIKFYKGGGANSGTHTVTLWDNAGSALATATVTNETASGWQTATFAAPVNIAANTTYVASYFAPAGNYSYDSNYFAVGIDNTPLHVPSNTAVTGNGVYKYGGGFPTDAFNATNYWVDVVYTQ